jgi:hypothetical protein
MEKTCFKCGVSKDLEEFYHHPQMAGGRVNKCIDCTRIDVRNHRINNQDTVRAYDRKRAQEPHRVALRRATIARYDGQYPERRKAMTAVNNAVRDGRLKKLPCAFCSASDGLEAHHHDYSKPLDVTWLCRGCHRRFHALERMATYDRDMIADEQQAA